MTDYNPNLALRSQSKNEKGGPAGLEKPDRVENIPWQTRAALPSAAENALATELQAAFAEGIEDLPQIIAWLERQGLTPPAGAARWTEEVLRAELHRLGA